MLSRVADSIYWTARYVERADHLSRFIDVTREFVLDVPTTQARQWEPLISVTGDGELFYERYEVADATSVMQFLTVDSEYPNSIASSLRAARENARSVREVIASEMWEQLNDFHQWFNREIRVGMLLRSPSDFYRMVMQQCMLFHGVTDETMSRDLGWHFANLGRQIERADKISRLLDVKYFTLLPGVDAVNSPLDDLQWSSLLRSVSGFEMYRKRYQEIDAQHVVDFLLLDRKFPRSIQYCLFEAERSLHAITGCPMGSFRCLPEQLLGRLCADLTYAEIETIISTGLHEFIDDLQARLNAVSKAIFDRFFAVCPEVEETASHVAPGVASQRQST